MEQGQHQQPAVIRAVAYALLRGGNGSSDIPVCQFDQARLTSGSRRAQQGVRGICIRSNRGISELLVATIEGREQGSPLPRLGRPRGCRLDGDPGASPRPLRSIRPTWPRSDPGAARRSQSLRLPRRPARIRAGAQLPNERPGTATRHSSRPGGRNSTRPHRGPSPPRFVANRSSVVCS